MPPICMIHAKPLLPESQKPALDNESPEVLVTARYACPVPGCRLKVRACFDEEGILWGMFESKGVFLWKEMWWSNQESRALESTLSGNMGADTLCHLLQFLSGSERTGCLVLSYEREKAKIYFSSGLVVDCRFRKFSGTEAFFQIMILGEVGTFDFYPDLSAGQVSMTGQVDFLLLESARRIDEQSRNLSRQKTPASSGCLLPP